MSRHITEIFQMVHRTFATCSMSLLTQIPLIRRESSFIVQVDPSAIRHPSIFCQTAQSKSSRLLQTNSHVKQILLLIFSSTRKRLKPNLICRCCKCLFPPYSSIIIVNQSINIIRTVVYLVIRKQVRYIMERKKCKMKKKYLWLYQMVIFIQLFALERYFPASFGLFLLQNS